MSKKKAKKNRPRYSFILNPHDHTRFSKCPICRKLTHMRKFALLIHIEGWGFLALGKTCRYCTPCELIITHRDELEEELVRIFEVHAEEVIGNPYLVIGTIDKHLWKESLVTRGIPLAESLDDITEFKEVLEIAFTGGWQPPPQSQTSK
jgi:hypothetical protein